jgi:hypothetical protein
MRSTLALVASLLVVSSTAACAAPAASEQEEEKVGTAEAALTTSGLPNNGTCLAASSTVNVLLQNGDAKLQWAAGQLSLVRANGTSMWASPTGESLCFKVGELYVLSGGQKVFTSMSWGGDRIVLVGASAQIFSGTKMLWARGDTTTAAMMSWCTTASTPYAVLQNAYATLWWQGDGNLVLYGADGKAYWASNTFGTGSSIMFCTATSGGLAIYKGNTLAWSSGLAGEGSTFALTNCGVSLKTSAGASVWSIGGNFCTVRSAPLSCTSSSQCASGLCSSGTCGTMPGTTLSLSRSSAPVYTPYGIRKFPKFTTITATGTNYHANEVVKLQLNDVGTTWSPTSLVTVTADASGNFSTSFNVPYVTGGAKKVIATDASGSTGVADLTVTPSASISNNNEWGAFVGGDVDDTMSIVAAGLKPNTAYHVVMYEVSSLKLIPEYYVTATAGTSYVLKSQASSATGEWTSFNIKPLSTMKNGYYMIKLIAIGDGAVPVQCGTECYQEQGTGTVLYWMRDTPSCATGTIDTSTNCADWTWEKHQWTVKLTGLTPNTLATIKLSDGTVDNVTTDASGNATWTQSLANQNVYDRTVTVTQTQTSCAASWTAKLTMCEYVK